MMQVELVLTFEEFCADDGEFAGERGSAFAAIFPQVIFTTIYHVWVRVEYSVWVPIK